MKGKYNMNTKGKIDFTKTDNIQFIEEVAREISKEDRDWQWEARKIKQHSRIQRTRLHGSCGTHARHMHKMSILAD